MKRILISTAVIGLAVAGIGTATAGPALEKVTGGGQIAEDMMTGPGQTLAFNARQFKAGETANADGQLQYNPHAADAETAKFHGRVTCLVVTEAKDDSDPVMPGAQPTPAMATLAGTYTNADGPGTFKLTIMDVDRDGPQNADEPLVFEPDADDQNCGEEAMGQSMELGRGNIVIHKANEPKA